MPSTEAKQLAATFAIGVVAAASFYRAPYPNELVLQHIPTAIALVGLAVSVVLLRPSRISFVCIAAFLVLHIVGARWIYSFVPYDAVFEKILGVSLSDTFQWERNHYDRFVHFAFGFLFVFPASEVLQRAAGMQPLGAVVNAIALVLAMSAGYEILEWQIAEMFSPAQADAYNGQQGDIWDPQKDMVLAGAGALIGAGAIFRQSFVATE